MVNLILYSYFLLIILFMLIFLLINFNLMDMNYVGEWVIYKHMSVNFSFLVYLDSLSLMFMMVVSLISMIVFLYSIEYMNGDKFIDRFSLLLFLFVFMMYLLILSPSILTILLGWDGLGLISYCLIIYYQNDKAFNAGVLTIFSNRIGDVGILLLISLSSSFGSWNLMNYYFDKYMLMILVIISFTKSAQIPFSLWLPAAMMAPTPVSSLVHSSTLVTAGVYLMIRYNKFLYINNLNNYIFFIASLTMFMAGLIANYEFDFKKIIALSTLSQLGLMMSILSLGLYNLSFFHLLIHALFKSLMFLCVGSFIHCFNNSQDIRSYGGLIYIYPFKSMVLLLSLFCLSGFPFLAGFYSKDLIMEMFMFNKLNMLSLVIMLFSTILTVSYSVRMMMYIVFFAKNYSVILFKKESLLMNICMLVLIFMIIFMGLYFYKIMFWNNFMLFSLIYKMIVLKLLLMGLVMGVFQFYMLKDNYVGYYMNNMFLMSKFYQLYKYPFNLIKFYEFCYEKGMFEYKQKIIKYLWIYVYNKFFFFNMNNLMIYILLFIFCAMII
uniref:NADH-ubiquinone oxidoreductase chain 5 n=1 Tax=Coelioxys fenestrata TaxID=621226 RepID=A0A7T4WNV8_9HYME|nr:NADH dehydrogenase subunit 5 [Coelioxys fenestrata]QQD78150.1 NADH dehydrogenase subunit 5 [Coelioxys fenestrata]